MENNHSKPPAPSAAPQGKTSGSHVSASKSPTMQLFSSAIIAAGQALSETQIALLEARGIDMELAVRMGWRRAKQGDFGDSLEIPYFKNGVEVNCKTRTLSGEKKFYQVADAEKVLYNIDVIKDIGDNPLIITEGEMDCMISLQCGYFAVSVPDGAPKEMIGDKSTVKYDYLSGIPQTVSRIILATDGDNPGINLMNDLALRLGKHRCQWVKYPKGCKDLNDAFIAWGKKGVDEIIARAAYTEIDGLYLIDELPPITEQPAYDVGIPALANHFRLRRGDFSVVTGIPSHGKTTWVNNIAFNMAKNHGWGICFASFEQTPQTEHLRELRTLFNGRPAHLLTPVQVQVADDWVKRKMSFIVPPDNSDSWFDMTWLKDRMAAAVTRHNAKMIVIDPWNEIDHVFDQREMSITQYVGKSIKDLKRFARRFNVHVMVIAHPAKMKRDKNGEYPPPTAYDISDSAHWYNKPEQVIVVHREEGKTKLRVAKSRYHKILGKPADVDLIFNDYNNTYS